MFFTTLFRITRTSILSFWRNRWLSLAATLIMVLTLFIISIFLSLVLITNKTTESLREKVDLIVYFNDSTTNDQIMSIQNVLRNRSGVKMVQYISKTEALDRWKDRNKDNEKIRDVINETDNPLPRSIEVKTQNPEDLEEIYTYLSSNEYKPLVSKISYQQNRTLIDRLIKMTKFVKISGWSLSVLFVLISILIIYNTIRLTIFARSEEISIMKLVGGSDWYVRGPFIIEGIGYGFVGAFISSIIFFFTYNITVPKAESYLGLTNINSNYLGMNLVILISIQFLIGILLGTFCSVLAIRKHLS